MTKQEKRIKSKHSDTETFTWYNANPMHHFTNDCVIRALSKALDIKYETVLSEITTKFLDQYVRFAKSNRKITHRDKRRYVAQHDYRDMFTRMGYTDLINDIYEECYGESLYRILEKEIIKIQKEYDL